MIGFMIGLIKPTPSTPLERLWFQVGRTFRQQLIRLEKLTSTHYKNRVHEISDNSNRSRSAGGVC